jgi:phosphoribosylglycinamide formyltransferase-1
LSEAERLPVVVLASGEGTNLQALIDAERSGALNASIRVVLSDRPEARALRRARSAGIPAWCLEPPGAGRAEFDAAVRGELERHRPGLVVLAGFMRILGADLVARYAGRILNIHPSLLPRHRGLDTHRRALQSGDSFHGATVHFVTPKLDSGPRVIQYRLRISVGDDPATLAQRVHRGEHLILPRAVAWFAAGRLRLVGGKVILDGREVSEPVLAEEAT